MRTPLGLTLAFLSALAVNLAYSLEHDAAASLPPLSLRRPLASVGRLLGSHAWLKAFATESGGWLVYVAALRLAPIALVQAVSASGIAVLAFLSARGRPSRLPWRERAAVAVACAGIVLLGLSLLGRTQSDRVPHGGAAAIWLGACVAGALVLARGGLRLMRGPALGLSAGLLFAGGDISVKLVVNGGVWLAALASLAVCYASGSAVLQAAFQHGDALTPAGLATLATNAVPIASGFVLFGERLPRGAGGALQIAAFAALVLSGALLTRRGPAPEASGDGGEAAAARTTPGAGRGAEGAGERQLHP